MELSDQRRLYWLRKYRYSNSAVISSRQRAGLIGMVTRFDATRPANDGHLNRLRSRAACAFLFE